MVKEDVFVVVGFRVDEEKSVYYKKCKGIEEVKKSVYVAFNHRKADFISIRRIEKKDEEIIE